MVERIKFEFKSFGKPGGGSVVVFVNDALETGENAAGALGPEVLATIARAATAEAFKGKLKKVLVIAAPQGIEADRLVVVGTGPAADLAKLDWVQLGGIAQGHLSGTRASLLVALPGHDVTPEAAADLTLGMQLRAYTFDKYKTKKDADEKASKPLKATLFVSDPAAARQVAKAREAVANGVLTARELVNEPPNVLYPEEFADRAATLEKVGVDVEILDEKQLKKLGFRALLGVAQGSHREARVVVMRWNGAGAKDQPVAFIGKGVTFDTGGISIKPGAGMEDMKGDMAGAACVVGLMQALAQRKARVNAVGLIGLVENMPDGRAQRPGDIVTSLSGQTIEIINTDAEGRLVLADVLWYAQDRFKPAFMIDLATLTGAILVALGQEHAGLFSNDDTLSERLAAAGRETGEKVWRMPLAPAYDKMIDSKFADMKNTGGRYGGSITAAQFLQRYVKDTPWAHLDIAGTGMNAPQTDINKSWGSGWGVRLLDRLVRDHYEG
ncbi:MULTISPECIES: leucyl aminopeptidase [unclassified Chelatococcus]|uniref:leucyl aminopeptidase n=1 Tax=unclassified Chelatococcus TaxID=2638111 RepID=UPI001BCDC6E7|nr:MULTISPECIES: leucyl aminopeptidase [unclassified Chelatococcus]MBS7738780.1 leucyl aminopeptidase [Chelatococcus sp. HY11]MBX3543184.1 leucyl aminopeptidase [Chelatococcus sp.]MCO5076689.1 leucyl aminopeptidase [Chelatococcus sp.]